MRCFSGRRHSRSRQRLGATTMAKRIPAAYKAVFAMAAAARARRNDGLAANGAVEIDRRDLRAGDVVLTHATLTPLFTVAEVLPASAPNYVVVTGTTPDGKPYRTSGHAI